MTRSVRVLLPSFALFVAAPAFAQAPTPLPPPPPPPLGASVPPAPPPPPPVMAAPNPTPAPLAAPPVTTTVVATTTTDRGGMQASTLKILHDKGILSDKEYESALKDMNESTGARTMDNTTVVMGKWATTLYGFAEADYISDTTQSLNDLSGNTMIAYPGTYAGEQGRTQFSIRNSRIGFRMKAPEYAGIRASAMAEMDFLGTQLAVNAGANTGSEAAFFNNPTFRVRHMNLKLETDAVDFLFGQYWELYGWQSVYHPNTVEIQGVPGQVYSRTMQLRISKTVKTEGVIFEAAIAALRPPQRNSQIPEGQAGLRFGINGWSGITTNGGTGTSIQPMSIAVTGDARAVRLPSYFGATETKADQATQKTGTAVAVDAFIPVIPAKKRQGNALSLNGELSTGYGNADVYTGLTGGAPAAVPQAPPCPAGTAPASCPTAPNPDLDTGIAMYDSQGNIHLVQWTSYLVGIQYYLPGLDGKAWISGNYSHIESSNLKNNFVAPTKFLRAGDWWDVNLFGDVTPAVRLGAEYANFNDVYGNGWHAINHRGQITAWYIF